MKNDPQFVPEDHGRKGRVLPADVLRAKGIDGERAVHVVGRGRGETGIDAGIYVIDLVVAQVNEGRASRGRGEQDRVIDRGVDARPKIDMDVRYLVPA